MLIALSLAAFLGAVLAACGPDAADDSAAPAVPDGPEDRPAVAE